MTASVIIPTYQGADKILNILHALERQTYKDFEVVVIVDGSTDQTVKILKERKFNLKSFQIVEQSNKGRAAARNSGAQSAKGDLLIFYDDDILPTADSVSRHFDFHRSDPLSTLLVGYSPQLVGESSTDFERYRAFISERWMAPYPQEFTSLVLDNLFLSTQNFSIKKKTFDKLLFNEQLTDSEDRELGIRAFILGLPIVFHRLNIGWHNERLTCKQYIKRLRQYSEANEKVNLMHPEISSFSKPEVSIYKKLFYGLVANRLFVNVIDRFNIFRILPKTIRYRFYDVITFSLSEIYVQVRF